MNKLNGNFVKPSHFIVIVPIKYILNKGKQQSYQANTNSQTETNKPTNSVKTK